MIIEQHALWGDEPTPERPATYTAYLADRIPAQEQKLFNSDITVVTLPAD